MNSDFILLLPDEVFYEMLISLPLEFVIQFEETYYKERKDVFESARLVIVKDLDVPFDFSFEQMKEYEEMDDNEDKASFLIKSGDYPSYVDKLANNVEDLSYLIEEAIDEKRDNTTLALLSQEGVDKEDYFPLVVSEKLYNSTLYLVQEINVEDTLETHLHSEIYLERYLNRDSLKWLLETFNFSLSEKFVTKYLSMDYLLLLDLLLQHLTKEDIRKAYENHLESLQTGISYYGSDYLQDLTQEKKDRVTYTFQQYL